MRGLLAGAVVVLLGFAAPVAAQDGVIPPLERLIDIHLEIPLPVYDCTVPEAVTGLGRRMRVAVGVEYLDAECARMGRVMRPPATERLDLFGLPVSQALDKVLALDPRYRMTQQQGMVVVRPVRAWADPKNLINFASSSFALENVTLGGALDGVLSAITGYEHHHVALLGGRTEQGARTFTVRTGAASVGQTLDAIVRAHGDSWWEIREGDVGRIIFFHTFDGSGIGASPGKAR